jgi:threonine aldolase
MAKLMHELVGAIPGVKVLFPHQVNSVFVDLPKPAIQAMYAKGWLFYNFIGEGGCRLMCSWDTQEEDVRAFAADLASVMPPETTKAAAKQVGC